MIPYLNLSSNWQTVESAGGPWTLMKKSGADANAFQISSMQRQSGRKLDPEPNLLEFATHFAIRSGGVVTESHVGDCVFGRYGTAIFKAREFKYCQCWTITDGVHFIFATYVCDAVPDSNELREVSAMAVSLKLIDDPSSKVN
jgi:hypothetical protein